MVAKTSRCLTCRARKIKCDMRWPCCGQCQKSKRDCPGPPTVIKFVEPQIHVPVVQRTALAPKENGNGSPITWPDFNFQEQTTPGEMGDNEIADLPLVLSRPISTTPANLVATELVKTLSIETAAHNPAFLGSFVKDIPCMLDQSPALTATVACALDACTKKQLLPRHSRRLDPSLYGKALTAIHRALESPEQRTCISTFLSVVLLGRLETVLATRQLARIPCWSVHASGISELLRYRGINNDETVFQAVLENFGPIVAHSIVRDQDCFLSAPEWQESLFSPRERRKVGVVDGLLYRVFAQLSRLPTLLKHFKVFRRSGNDEGAFARTMDLASIISMELRAIGGIMDRDILGNLDVGCVPEEDYKAPIEFVYVLPGDDVVRLISWHSVLSNIVDKVLIALLRMAEDGDAEERERSLEELRRDALVASRRTWMLSQEAKQKGVIQFYFYPGVLAVTYDSARNDAEREWVVDLLNDVQGSTWSENLWTHEAVAKVCLTLGGQLD